MSNPGVLEATINQLAIMLTFTALSNSAPSCDAHVFQVCTSSCIGILCYSYIVWRGRLGIRYLYIDDFLVKDTLNVYSCHLRAFGLVSQTTPASLRCLQ